MRPEANLHVESKLFALQCHTHFKHELISPNLCYQSIGWLPIECLNPRLTSDITVEVFNNP